MGEQFLDYRGKTVQYRLPIKPGGYIPKTGLALCMAITKQVKGKRVLDIGAGETALAALHSAFLGAKAVVATDIDKNAVAWARKVAKYSRPPHAKILRSNLYPSHSAHNTFDLIISNPPQMPMKKGHAHDAGGFDGRKYIIEILERASDYLSARGKVVITVFDFLIATPVHTSRAALSGNLKSVAQQLGYKMKIVKKFQRTIRSGGETEKNLKLIKSIYPEFILRKTSSGLTYHYVYALEFVKT